MHRQPLPARHPAARHGALTVPRTHAGSSASAAPRMVDAIDQATDWPTHRIRWAAALAAATHPRRSA